MTTSAAVAQVNQSPLMAKPDHLSNKADYVTHFACFRFIRFLLDVAALAGAWRVTLEVRVWLNPLMPLNLSADLVRRAAPPLTAMLLLWGIASLLMHIYSERLYTNSRSALVTVAQSVGVMSVQAIAVIVFSRELGIDRSRSFVPVFAIISFLLLTASYYAALAAALCIERRWPSIKGMAVIGSGAEAEIVVHSIQSSKHGKVVLKGVITPQHRSPSLSINGCQTLGTTRELAELINRERLQRIIIADSSITEREFEQYRQIARPMNVIVSRPLGDQARVKKITHFGLELIELRPDTLDRGHELLKRSLDLLIASVGLIFVSPLFLSCMVLIKLTSRGPIFYKSVRVGRGGRYFTFWKFRSMYISSGRQQVQTHNEKQGHIFKVKNDPRVTPLGKILRRYSLDEIPQLINVLIGDMSIVGPRPLPAEDLDPDGKSSTYKVWAEERSRVRPGITGLWQVSGRSDLDFRQMVDLDIQYTRTWSLGLDLAILCQTPQVVIFGRGAY